MQEVQVSVPDSGGNTDPAPAGNDRSGEKKPVKSNTKIFLAAALIIIFIFAFGAWKIMAKPTTSSGKTVLLQTNMGNIKIQLYSDMPVTAGNFEKLAKQGFYDGIVFHRVISDFMIQGGDPTGTGAGGPGYNIKDEFTNHNKNDRGTISMANAGPNTGGSQFFINLVSNNFLDSKHPVFGKVIEGMDVVDAIGKTKTNADDRPVSEVKIIKAEVL